MQAVLKISAANIATTLRWMAVILKFDIVSSLVPCHPPKAAWTVFFKSRAKST
jgi:hypothetical protein